MGSSHKNLSNKSIFSKGMKTVSCTALIMLYFFFLELLSWMIKGLFMTSGRSVETYRNNCMHACMHVCPCVLIARGWPL